MKHLSLVRPALVCLVSALAFSSCASSTQANNHWHIDSIGPRVDEAFLGHQPVDGAEYYRQVRDDMASILVTLQRHLLNDNPTNPLLPRSSRPAPKPELPDRVFTVSR